MAPFDAYRSPAELRKLYAHCQYLTRGSGAIRLFKHQSMRVAAAFLRAAIDVPASGNAGNQRRLSESIARLALTVWQGVDGRAGHGPAVRRLFDGNGRLPIATG